MADRRRHWLADPGSVIGEKAGGARFVESGGGSKPTTSSLQEKNSRLRATSGDPNPQVTVLERPRPTGQVWTRPRDKRAIVRYRGCTRSRANAASAKSGATARRTVRGDRALGFVASILLVNGAPVKVVSERVGDATPAFAMTNTSIRFPAWAPPRRPLPT
jgi:hypothetical protein